jgi:hypothetical protein
MPTQQPPERPPQNSKLQTAVITAVLVVAGVLVVATGSTTGLADLGTVLLALAILIGQLRSC